MTDYCKIGYINLITSHLVEDDEHKYQTEVKELQSRFTNRIAFGFQGNKEVMKVLCTNYQAKQIIGLANSKELVWIDSTTDITDVHNNFLHKGWYIIGNPEKFFENPDLVTLKMELYPVSLNPNEWLTMGYSTGNNDDTKIGTTYDLSNTVSYLNDSFATFDTTNNWNAVAKNGMTTGSITSDGSKLIFAGKSNTNGTWNHMWTTSKNTYAFPKYFEFPLEWVTQPAGYDVYLSYYLMPSRPQTGAEFTGMSNWLRVVIGAKNRQIWFQKKVNGVVSPPLYQGTLTVGQRAPRFKIRMESTGYGSLYLDKDGGTNYSKVFGPTNIGLTFSTAYVTLALEQKDSTSQTMKMDSLSIYDNEAINFNNISALPVTPSLETAADFTRASEDGNVPCFKNPSVPLKFKITPANFYLGGCKAFNYFDSVWNRMSDTEDLVTPGAGSTFYVTNGMTKLDFKSTGIDFSYWNGSIYVVLNTFTLPGTISFVKPRFISSEKIVVQVENTLWTINRGRRFVTVEHPGTAIGFTRKTCYYANSGAGYTTTVGPIANADISMQGFPYCNIWDKGSGTCAAPDPVQNFRLQILKTDPATIKSDSIPASQLTGIAWFDNTVADTNSADYYANVYKEFFMQTKQKIGIKRM